MLTKFVGAGRQEFIWYGLALVGLAAVLGLAYWRTGGTGLEAVARPSAPVISASPAPTIVRDLDTPVAASSGTYALGDRLKLTFYERIELGEAPVQASARPRGQSLIERAELTGEYVVQQNGQIFIPLLGSITAEGRTTEQLVGALESAFMSALQQVARVSVVVAEREPIYVVGQVTKPGTFKYTPAMTVLHAVALSGGGADPRADFAFEAEFLRERERSAKAMQRLRKLLPRAEVLRAERDGQSVEGPPPRVVELIGAAEAKVETADAVRIRKIVLASRQPQLTAFQSAVAVARRDAKNLSQKLAVVQGSVEARSQRRQIVAELRQRGSGNAYLAQQVAGEVSDALERRHDVVTAMSQAELRLSQADQELAKLEADWILERERELQATWADIAELEATLASSLKLNHELRVSAYRLMTSRHNVAYEIVRRSRLGPQRFVAHETSELYPGDLLNIASTRPATAE